MIFITPELTTHEYARHALGVQPTYEKPEGVLLRAAQEQQGLKTRQVAPAAGISEGRWRQIIKGYTSMGGGQKADVVGPADTVARMALALHVEPADLRAAGRDDAADFLLMLLGGQTESEARAAASPLKRLIDIRADIDALIGELRANGPGA